MTDKLEYDFLFKVLLLGNASVGKTALFGRFFTEEFKETDATIGVDFKTKDMTLTGKSGGTKLAKLQIWDTSGSERYRSMTNAYYRGAHGCLIVYDITDYKSFQAIDDWMDNVKAHADESIVPLLIGNKCDLEDKREVSIEDGEKLAERLGVKFIETSAKSGQNVEQSFALMAQEMKAAKSLGLSTYNNEDLKKSKLGESKPL